MSDDLQPEDLVDKATAWDVLTKKNDQIADLRAQLAEANARAERCESVVKNLHLLGLVIESAVRHADIQHHAAVLALVKAARQALPPDPQEPESRP